MTETILNDISLFKGMIPEQIRELQPFFHKKKFKKNEMIFMEEDTNKFMYIILNGKVKVTRITQDGKEQLLSIHKAGEFFGEMSLIDSMTEPATVTAKEDCTLIIISKSDFKKLLLNHEFSEQLMMILCKRLRNAWNQMEWLTMLNASEKLKAIFKFLAGHYGREEKNYIKIMLKMTHAEFGELAGMSRETVSRELNKLKSKDYIKKEFGHFFVKRNWYDEEME